MNNEFLGKEKVGKLLVKLATPAVIAQLINMLYNLVDRIYIGHIPDVGRLALTGVGVCLPIILIISAFAQIAGMGGAPKASISMGKKNNAQAELYVGNAFTYLVIISIILTVSIELFAEPLLSMFGASENTISYGTSYLKIYAIGTIFVQLTLGMNAFIACQGFAKTSMATTLIGALLNIVLDPILIFGFKMGVNGAALATIISQSVSAIWVILFLLSKKSILKLRLKNMILKAKVIIPVLSLGFAPFIMQSTESIVMVCFNRSLLEYGGDLAVGAMTILLSVMQFALLPLNGLGQGAQPIISYNYGANDEKRVKDTFKYLLISCCAYIIVLWLMIEIFPSLFAIIFTKDQELIKYASWALRIYMGTSVLMGIQMACQFTLIALENSKASAIIALLRKLGLLIPLIYIMPLIITSDKSMAVYIAEPIADFLAVTMTVIIFTFQFKKALNRIRNNKEKALENKLVTKNITD